MDKGCFIASIDLKHAFHTIPMTSEFTKYLKFQINEIILGVGVNSVFRGYRKIEKMGSNFMHF